MNLKEIQALLEDSKSTNRFTCLRDKKTPGGKIRVVDAKEQNNKLHVLISGFAGSVWYPVNDKDIFFNT